eukprot:717207_1
MAQEPEQKKEDKKEVKKDDYILTCEGFDALTKLLDTVKSKRIFLLFCGSLINGKSWCPDCVASKPVIEQNMKYVNKDTDTFITVYVGDLRYWKDKNNPFRTDKRFKVTGVPTLLQYGTQKRLVEPQCCNNNLVQMLLEGDDDDD